MSTTISAIFIYICIIILTCIGLPMHALMHVILLECDQFFSEQSGYKAILDFMQLCTCSCFSGCSTCSFSTPCSFFSSYSLSNSCSYANLPSSPPLTPSFRGFELLGPARRVCGQEGTWTPQGIPFCGQLTRH